MFQSRRMPRDGPVFCRRADGPSTIQRVRIVHDTTQGPPPRADVPTRSFTLLRFDLTTREGHMRQKGGTTRRELLKYGGAGIVGFGMLGRSWPGARADNNSGPDIGALHDILDPCFDKSPVVRPFSAPLP